MGTQIKINSGKMERAGIKVIYTKDNNPHITKSLRMNERYMLVINRNPSSITLITKSTVMVRNVCICL